jgi:hypothetical protein
MKLARLERWTTPAAIALVIAGDMGDYVVALQLSDSSVHAYFVMCGAGLDTERCFLGPPDLRG